MVEKVDEKNPSQEWDYYGEEVANDERKRRQALGGDFGQQEVEKQNSRKKRDGRKSSAIRINQEMTEIKNNTEPLLVEDPPGIGLGHILGITTTLFTNINQVQRICVQCSSLILKFSIQEWRLWWSW